MTTLNRAPFNLLVDDPGDNLTGTIWNKGEIAGVILDPVDAALAQLDAAIVAAVPAVDKDVSDVDTSAALGAQNDFAYAATGGGVFTYTGAGAVVYSGWANGVNGRRVQFQNLGTGPATFLNQSALSVAANRFITTTSADLDVPVGAFAELWYDGAAARWRISIFGGGGGGGTLAEVTVTTTGNIVDLNVGVAPVVLLRMNNATLATIQGMIPGVANQVVHLESVGAGHVNLAHQDAGEATAARRLFNAATSGPTPLAAGAGTAILQHDTTAGRWKLIAHVQGAFITPPYSAADFTASGAMVWTVDPGDVITYAYYLNGRALQVSVYIVTASISGTISNAVRVKIPGGFIASARIIAGQVGVDNAVAVPGYIDTNAPPSTIISYLRNDGASWQASTNNHGILGTINFPVQ